MKAFIDDFRQIRIESYEYIHHIHINGYQITWQSNLEGIQYFKTDKPLRLHETDHIYINFTRYPLEIGLVTLTKAFDQKFRYRGSLGAIYQKNETTFKVFSPVAKEVYVVLDGIAHPMTFKSPIWQTTIHGDLHNKPYHYKVRLVDTFKDVKDPYAKGTNLKSDVVIDLEQTAQLRDDYVRLNRYEDAVIYEGHVRDLTIGLDVDYKGTYLGLVNHSYDLNGLSVLDYIKGLGMTHFQILPVFDFEGVDDINKDDLYNWGYNPSKYFCLEGWYSNDPNDPLARINEFKEVVNRAHSLDLGIVMDVVFNHVYLYKDFPYDHLVPGYFYRHDAHDKMTDSSYCGNDIETRRYMVRKLIIDNLSYFVKEFKIDGFRFDLMGLMDLKTMNQIEKALRRLNPNIILYGEGWNMDLAVPKKDQSNMDNAHKLPSYGFFNDHFRDFFKGKLHEKDLGFISGNGLDVKTLTNLLNGSPHRFKHAGQSINYVECHDNLTLFDRLSLTQEDASLIEIMMDFANHLIAIAKGVPFYHAGQEFYQTKQGVENSYNSGDDINAVSWLNYGEEENLITKLLRFRSRHPFFKNNKLKYHFDRYEGYYLSKDLEGHVLVIKYDFNKSVMTLKKAKNVFKSQLVIKQKDAYILNMPGVYIFKL